MAQQHIAKIEAFFLLALFVITAALRFPQLGFSHFYGDETKTLYTRKDIAASDFLLNQRKGPVQFVVVWATEKLTNGFTEFSTRLPFAISGTLAVFVFYFVVKELFDRRIASLASLMLSTNGFYVAFSRTVQYQTFLLLFGLAGILFTLLYTTGKNYNKYLWLFLAGVALALSLLSHYDAVFFIIPSLYAIFANLKGKKEEVKKVFLYFAIPFLILSTVFYIPYIKSGMFTQNTVGYLVKRVSGQQYLPNNSLYTAKTYNPFFISFIPLFFALFAFAEGLNWKKAMIYLWALVPFIVFEFGFLNPGTHIHTYILPAFILSAIGIMYLYDRLSTRAAKNAYIGGFTVVFILIFVVNSFTYIPFFNSGYPWKNTKILGINVNAPSKNYHLYLYGFPYYRGWDQIRSYLFAKSGVRNVYTNDNETLAEYYLYKYDVAAPGSNFLPQYYIYVMDNQEFKYPSEEFLSAYTLEKEIYTNEVLSAKILKLK